MTRTSDLTTYAEPGALPEHCGQPVIRFAAAPLDSVATYWCEFCGAHCFDWTPNTDSGKPPKLVAYQWSYPRALELEQQRTAVLQSIAHDLQTTLTLSRKNALEPAEAFEAFQTPGSELAAAGASLTSALDKLLAIMPDVDGGPAGYWITDIRVDNRTTLAADLHGAIKGTALTIRLELPANEGAPYIEVVSQAATTVPLDAP